MKRVVIMAMLTGAVFVATGQALPRINIVHGVVHVTGLGNLTTLPQVSEEHWGTVLSVYTDEAFMKGLDQPVAGKYSCSRDSLAFKPIYPFSGGTTYRAVFSPDAYASLVKEGHAHSSQNKIEYTFQIPGEMVSATAIEAVYPASNVLPENLLRMYICFSAPMMPGEAYEHLSLVNERGERIEKPFLIIDQELWDASRTRFTILFDPGRIKRGLRANLELGAPLKEGEQYSLRIDPAWRDVNGNNLQHGLVKTFRVGAPERARLSAGTLTVVAPPAATREPLVIHFNRAMDRALVFRYVTIQDMAGRTMAGELELDNDEQLIFTPDTPWLSANYHVVLSPLLEDVAGNNFLNAFDVDLARDSRQMSDETVTLQVPVISH